VASQPTSFLRHNHNSPGLRVMVAHHAPIAQITSIGFGVIDLFYLAW